MRLRARQVYLGAAQRYSVTYVYMISTYIHELYTGKLRQKSTWYTAAPSMITEWCGLEPCTRWYRVNGVRAQQIRQGAITCNKHSVLYCYRNCLSRTFDSKVHGWIHSAESNGGGRTPIIDRSSTVFRMDVHTGEHVRFA